MVPLTAIYFDSKLIATKNHLVYDSLVFDDKLKVMPPAQTFFSAYFLSICAPDGCCWIDCYHLEYYRRVFLSLINSEIYGRELLCDYRLFFFFFCFAFLCEPAFPYDMYFILILIMYIF